ncbi:uncharacterized protein DSM5745_05981 [Aspergillus mulundensis]|uniref:Uncharacterized protein n=1 Tax=Aspergillus mulundensis TaxID=1810919 RepID=A0A3D8RYJ9_9EURO|nr:hypothetical protein DSM5745_05981 [Aspergillus mulundensis]RDW79129.1 hypothetical protein DSM5745_05981 [Aspergillus mulundensis]
MSSTNSFHSARSTMSTSTQASGPSTQNTNPYPKAQAQTQATAKAKYEQAAAACSTAALAASNAAAFYTSALQYLALAMDVTMSTTTGTLGPDDAARILATCQVGIEAAVTEAVQAAENANAAAQIAEDLAGDADEDEQEGLVEYRWLLGDENEDLDEDGDADDVSVLGEIFETESVMGEWEALKTNLMTSGSEGPGSGKRGPNVQIVRVDGNCDTPDIRSHAHAAGNDAQYTPETTCSSDSPTAHRPPTPPPKSCWGAEVGEFAGGLVTKRPSAESLYTAFGEVTEILFFDTLVLVEPIDKHDLAGFQKVSLPDLRMFARTVYETPPEIGEESWGFLLTEESDRALLCGVGRVVGVAKDEKVCLVKREDPDCEEEEWFDVCLLD